MDQSGTPFGVKIQGESLGKGQLLDLPTQPLRIITPAEAYQRCKAYNQRLEAAIGQVGAGQTSSGQAIEFYRSGSFKWGWGWLLGLLGVGMVLGLVLLFFNSSYRTDSQTSGADSSLKTSSDSYNPLGPPTISLNTFRGFLQELDSPALSEAEQMFKVCLEEGADPALALAFFEHESGGGKAGVAVITRSLGNIRCSAGYSCYVTPGNGSFRQYSTWTESARDWARLLQYYRTKLKLVTLEQIIPVYAPANDHNNEVGYVLAVKNRVDNLRSRGKQ